GGAGCASCMNDQWGNQSSWGWDDPSGYGQGYGNFENFDNCGFVPRASFYGIIDALYWTRTKGSFIGTTFGGLPGFDYDWGVRATLGGRTDQVSGYELSFLGIMPLEQERQILSPGGGINALFEPAGGLNFGHVSSFFNMVEANQFARSRLYSVEFNRVRWGWDIVKTHIGLRYIHFDDQYLLRSRNFFNNQGEMELAARNDLFGPNVGIDLFYDVGRRTSFSWFLKAGGYANSQRTSFELTNNGTQFVNNRDSNGRFSGSVDGGVNAHMHLRQNARLRAGYSVLYLYKVASATENYPAFVTPLTGLSSDTKSSVFFHGATFGLEFYR
ncbi:MAG TPA: hypothetical protein PKD54_15160, partial [Pirellulaceae bacterium]|nr:hypothetical protein [Pirellulaceae bacterium]